MKARMVDSRSFAGVQLSFAISPSNIARATMYGML
jgi:hypothetical protein